MTGWTWETVRTELDMPRVEALRAAWKNNPPLAVTMRLAAEGLGVEFASGNLTKPAGSSGEPELMTDPTGLMGMLGQTEPVPYKRPAMGVPIARPEAA